MQAEPAARRPGTPRLGWARAADGGTEASSDQRASGRLLPVRAPTRALVALGAAHALTLPVDRKVRDVERTLLMRLPTLVRPRGADQVNAVLLAGRDQLLRADISRVDQVLGGGKSRAGQGCVDRAGAHRLVHVGRCGVGVD